MSLVPPPIQPVQIPDGIINYRPISAITPFTYRSGMTYQALLEAIRVYAVETLTNYTVDGFEDQQDAWQENVDALVTAVNAALDAQASHVSDELARTLAEILTGANNNLNDGLIHNALALAGSTSLAYLDQRYAAEFDVLGAASAVRDLVLAREYVSPAPLGNNADDTSSLQTWMNSLPSGSSCRIRSGAFTIGGTLTIPDTIKVNALGAKFTGVGSVAADLWKMGNSTRLESADITFGTRPGGRPILASNVKNARIINNYIHDIKGLNVNDGPGIRAEAGATQYFISGNRIERVNGQGIAVDSAPIGTIEGNMVDTAYHGIQWWGGDSASSSAIGIHHVIINNNRVRNVHGGIWGSLGQYIGITGNEVDNCSDGGIDFEGCLDSVASANTVQRCVNAGLMVFYGSQRCKFTGNVVDMTGFTGAGFKAFTNKTSSFIEVTDNLFRTDQGPGVATDQQALADSTIRGNRIISVTQGVLGMRLLECGNMSIEQNVIRVACPTGISFEGGTDSRIENNEILTVLDGSSVGANSAGILIYWRSTQYPAKRNRIRNNIIRGFSQGIFDNCWNDLASSTLIENNVSSVITTRANSNPYLFNNRNESTHAPVNPTII